MEKLFWVRTCQYRQLINFRMLKSIKSNFLTTLLKMNFRITNKWYSRAVAFQTHNLKALETIFARFTSRCLLIWVMKLLNWLNFLKKTSQKLISLVKKLTFTRGQINLRFNLKLENTPLTSMVKSLVNQVKGLQVLQRLWKI